MTRDEALAEIRRQGRLAGGRLSMRAFQRNTGISLKQLLGKHWLTWNDAIAEAGLDPHSFNRRKGDDDQIVEAFAQFVQRLEHWPTENEIRLERRRDDSVPSLEILKRLRKTQTLSRWLLAHCDGRPDLAVAAAIAENRVTAEPSDSRPAKVAVEGWVYMWRAGSKYKIGFSKSPDRRYRDVAQNMPLQTSRVHAIATDDPPGIEAYWKTRFEAKRIKGTEFFKLDAADVAAFKRRKFQ